MHNITFSFQFDVNNEHELGIKSDWPEAYLKLEPKNLVHVLKVACEFLHKVIADSKIKSTDIPPVGTYAAVVSINGSLTTRERQYTAELITSDSFERLSIPAANLCLQKATEMLANQAVMLINKVERVH